MKMKTFEMTLVTAIILCMILGVYYVYQQEKLTPIEAGNIQKSLDNVQ